MRSALKTLLIKHEMKKIILILSISFLGNLYSYPPATDGVSKGKSSDFQLKEINKTLAQINGKLIALEINSKNNQNEINKNFNTMKWLLAGIGGVLILMTPLQKAKNTAF